jgi:hypothetical protein
MVKEWHAIIPPPLSRNHVVVGDKRTIVWDKRYAKINEVESRHFLKVPGASDMVIIV